MKKKGKSLIIVLLVMIILSVIYFCFSFCYSSNSKMKNYYFENKSALNGYIDNFDENSFMKSHEEIENYFPNDAIITEGDYLRKVYEIPESLSKQGVNSIENYNGYLFFDCGAYGAYYSFIYYSFDGSPSQNCPIYSNDSNNENYKFRQVGRGIYINGKKNAGIDWYKTECIENNWYYCEVHLS